MLACGRRGGPLRDGPAAQGVLSPVLSRTLLCGGDRGEREAHLCKAECGGVRRDLGLQGCAQGSLWPCPLLLDVTCRTPRTPRGDAERGYTRAGHSWCPLGIQALLCLKDSCTARCDLKENSEGKGLRFGSQLPSQHPTLHVLPVAPPWPPQTNRRFSGEPPFLVPRNPPQERPHSGLGKALWPSAHLPSPVLTAELSGNAHRWVRSANTPPETPPQGQAHPLATAQPPPQHPRPHNGPLSPPASPPRLPSQPPAPGGSGK